MIVSKQSKRVLTNSILFFLIISFFVGCSCCQDADARKHQGIFNWEAFFITEAILMMLVLMIGSMIFLSKRRLTITDKEVIVKPWAYGQEIRFDLTEIVNMTWDNSISRLNGGRYGGTVSVQNQSFSVDFSDDSVLSINGSDYANFDEMKDFFYDYCISHGIIHVLPLTERKKSIFQRRNRH